MNPLDTPASEWSSQTLQALEDKRAQESELSGRDQAAAILAQKTQQQAAHQQTVDQQLGQSAPVIPTRQPVVEAIPAVAYIEEPVPSLHTTAQGLPHVPQGMPISATAQTGGFAEPRISEVKAVPAAIVGDTAVVAVPAVAEMTTQIPGKELKTVPDLSAMPGTIGGLASHNPFNPTHTPGFLDAESRTMTGGTTPGMELPGGWGAVLKTQGAAAKPDTETSLSEDVTAALHEVGRTAFSVLPQSIVDKVSNHHTPGTATTGTALPSAQQVRETTGNVAANVGNTASNVGSQVYETSVNAGSIVGNTAANVGSQVYDTTLNAGSAVTNTAANLGSQVYATTANLGSAIGNTTAQAANTTAETAAQAGQTVRETTSHAAESLTQAGQGLLEQARHALDGLHLPGFGAPIGQETHATTTSTTANRGVSGVSGTQQESVVDRATHMAQELLGATQSKAEEAYNAVRGETTGVTDVTEKTGSAEAKSWRGTLEGYTERAATQVAEFGGHSTNPDIHNRAATSLPSEETTGAHPGEQSAGVGALPGSKFAEGVAVLPEERRLSGDNSAQAGEGRGVAQIKTLASNHGTSGETTSETKHEGYAPSGPAMGLSGTPAYQQETGHSHLARGHGHGQETYEAPHRSLTEIIKDGANKADQKTTSGSHTEGYAPSGPVADLSGHRDTTGSSSGVASASKVSGERVTSSGSYELAGSSEQHGKSTEGYAPSGPAVGLSKSEESTTGHVKKPSYELGGLSGVSTTNTQTETRSGEGYAPSGPAVGFSKTEESTTGHSKKPSYELGGLTGTSAADTSKTETRSGEGYAPSGPAVGLAGSRTEESTSGHSKKPSYELAGFSGASTANTTQTESSHRVESTGAHTMSASSGITRPEQSSTDMSGISSSTTYATSSGSGPDYDLAPPLGAIVGSTPLSSHVQTDRSHNPVLPGNIPAALTHEPVAVAAPSDSTTVQTATAVEHSQGTSRGSTYNSKDSDVVSPGSTIESEQTHASAVNPALAAARFQAAPKPDRVDSSASTTAIIHGKPGNPHHEQQPSAGSSLAAVTEKDLPKSPKAEVIQTSSTSHSTTTNTATRAPGTETGAVGGKDLTTANSEPHKTVKEEFAAVGHGTLDKPASSVAAKEAPKTESSAIPGQGRAAGAPSATTAPLATTGDYVPSQHARTGSSGSGASKRSFLDKLKDKIHHKKH